MRNEDYIPSMKAILYQCHHCNTLINRINTIVINTSSGRLFLCDHCYKARYDFTYSNHETS